MDISVKRLTFLDFQSDEKRKSNIELILGTQLSKLESSEEKKGYDIEMHRSWIDSAIKDIRENKRVLFVAQGPYPAKWEEGIFSDVIASVIVKKNHSNILELKNLYIYKENCKFQLEKARGKDFNGEKNEYETILGKLLEKVERFCQKRGFRSLEIAIPDEKNEKLRVLTDKGFQVISSVDSNSNSFCYIYTLRKILHPSYVGDSYNFELMTLWLLRNIFLFKECKVFNNKKRRHKAFNGFEFQIPSEELKYKAKYYFQQDKEKASKYHINGICVYSDSDRITELKVSDIRKIVGNHYQLYFIFFTAPSSEPNNWLPKFKKGCIRSGIYALERYEDIYPLLGDLFKQKTKFPRNDLKGLIIEIDEDFLSRGIERNEDFSHCFLNGIGTTLFELNNEKRDNEEKYYIFYYIRQLKNGDKREGIIGYSILINGDLISLNEAKDNFRDKEKVKNFLFSKNEFDAYSIYYSGLYSLGFDHKEKSVALLNLSKIYLFKQGHIDITNKENISKKLYDTVTHIEKEEGNFNNLYIDSDTVLKLLKKPISE